MRSRGGERAGKLEKRKRKEGVVGEKAKVEEEKRVGWKREEKREERKRRGEEVVGGRRMEKKEECRELRELRE